MNDGDEVILNGDVVRSIRHGLHELANAFTGVMIAGGLLSQYLEGGSLEHYASDICEGSERGCALVREIRSQLLGAQGEVEAPNGNPHRIDSVTQQQNSQGTQAGRRQR